MVASAKRVSGFFKPKAEGSSSTEGTRVSPQYEAEAFKPIEGTQAYLSRVKTSYGKRLSPQDPNWRSIFDHMHSFAAMESDHRRYKTAAMLIGRRPNGEIALYYASNTVPFALAQKGVKGEHAFMGKDRLESPTVHAEMHDMLASAGDPLTEKILVTSDPICPNCAKCAAAFGIEHYVMHREGYERPIYVERVSADDSYNRVSVRVLERAGIQRWEFDDSGLHAYPSIGKFTSPVQKFFVPYSPYSDLQIAADIRRNLMADEEEGIASVVSVMRRRDGHEILYTRSADLFTGEEELLYKRRRATVMTPVQLLLSHMASEGLDPKKASFSIAGELDVDCALLLAASMPKDVRVFAGKDSVLEGAQRILDMSGIPTRRPSARRNQPAFAA